MVQETAVIDATLLSEIPLFQRPLTLTRKGCSAWALNYLNYRIDTKNDNGKDEHYFMKVAFDEHGMAARKGEYEATSEIHAVAGDFAPKPIAWGTFKSRPDAHYYICKFYELDEGIPEPAEFCARLAELHKLSVSPNGKFGFHVVTYNGNLPQENGYADTWEQFFVNGFEHMLNLNIERGGPWEEMEALRPPMLSKVIPRLLRPMETGGRSIKPSLVHGDLWHGNTAVDKQTGHPLIYDPASFYAHNEYELGNWRPERIKFPSRYFQEYHLHIPQSMPKEDYDDRNALYSIRFDLQAAALFPDVGSYRQSVVDEMKRLIAKYPGGYEAYES